MSVHAKGRRGPFAVCVIFLLAVLAVSGCGPSQDEGAASVRLIWSTERNGGTRAGVLEGIVDTVRVRVFEQQQELLNVDFDYAALQGLVENIPAGPDRTFVAEALGQGTVVYSGQKEGVEVLGGQTVNVDIVMSPAYETDVYPPAPINDLSARAEEIASCLPGPRAVTTGCSARRRVMTCACRTPRFNK